jgi:hypothetical protein
MKLQMPTNQVAGRPVNQHLAHIDLALAMHQHVLHATPQLGIGARNLLRNQFAIGHGAGSGTGRPHRHKNAPEAQRISDGPEPANGREPGNKTF